MTEKQRGLLAEKPAEFLKSCLYHEQRIKEKLEQMQSYKEIAAAIMAAAENAEVFGQEEPIKLLKCAEEMEGLQDSIEKEVTALKEDVQLVQEAIALLDDDYQKLLMEARYLRHMKWEEISILLACSYRWTLRLHGIALKKISKEAILIHI